MKIHDVEVIDENAAYVAYRRAVPGGWLYCERIIEATGQSIACERVPDPTAEHVTHGAGGAAAAEIYRDAVNDCCDVVLGQVGSWLITDGQRNSLLATLRRLRFDGEGAAPRSSRSGLEKAEEITMFQDAMNACWDVSDRAMRDCGASQASREALRAALVDLSLAFRESQTEEG